MIESEYVVMPNISQNVSHRFLSSGSLSIVALNKLLEYVEGSIERVDGSHQHNSIVAQDTRHQQYNENRESNH